MADEQAPASEQSTTDSTTQPDYITRDEFSTFVQQLLARLEDFNSRSPYRL